MSRHFINPSSDESKAGRKQLTPLKSLSTRQIAIQMESVIYQLDNDSIWLTEGQVKGLCRRLWFLKTEMLKRLEIMADRSDEKAYEAELEVLRNPLGLSLLEFLREESKTRKAKARNSSFYRKKKPSPTGKAIGAYRFERPKKGPDRLIKDKGK